jgi:hypothetical protein
MQAIHPGNVEASARLLSSGKLRHDATVVKILCEVLTRTDALYMAKVIATRGSDRDGEFPRKKPGRLNRLILVDEGSID